MTYQDRLNNTGATVFGIHRLWATDSAGRSWHILEEDITSAPGSVTVPFPNLSSLSLTTLAKGTWVIRAESGLYNSSSFANDDYILEERWREEGSFARSASVNFTIN